MRYTVDVKVFVSVTVEAEDMAAARDAADQFVQTLEPHPAYVGGYNMEQEAQGLPTRVVSASGFDIDGISEVEKEDSDALS